MKKPATILVFFVLTISALGQNIIPSKLELQKHDLFWIKSKNHFNQLKYSEAQINLEICNIIRQASFNNILTKDIEVPINNKSLKYLGYKHPNRLRIFDIDTITSGNGSSLNKKLHIYKYENFYISTESDDAISQQNIYYTIRAINILRSRYEKAYQKLFLETSMFKTEKPQFKNYANSNKAYWIAYNESADGMAKSSTLFIRNGFFPKIDSIQIGKYKNIPLIDIHSKKILGDISYAGSSPIYQMANPKENYDLYMREGLIETIIHEMLHRYIDYSYTFEKRSLIVFSEYDKDYKNFQPADESSIVNTSLSYFIKTGGFTDNIFTYYYKNVFEFNMTKLKSNKFYDFYGKFYVDTIIDKSAREIFRYSVLD